MNLLKRAYLAAGLLASAFAVPAKASPVLLGSPTFLTGVHNLSVDGTLYDVSFVDGTCASVYGLCDAPHFDFNSGATAGDAATAMLNAIAGTYFDTHPNDATGCGPGASCVFEIPYDTGTFGSVPIFFAQEAINSDLMTDQVLHVGQPVTFDTANGDPRYVWTRFGLAAADSNPVPEPLTLSLFGVGVAGLIAARRRRSNWDRYLMKVRNMNGRNDAPLSAAAALFTMEKSEETNMKMRSAIAACATASVLMLGAAPAYAGMMISSFTPATDTLGSGSSQLLTLVLTAFNDGGYDNTTITSGTVRFNPGDGHATKIQSFGAVGATTTLTESFVYTGSPGQIFLPSVEFTAFYTDTFADGTPGQGTSHGNASTGFLIGTPDTSVTTAVPEPVTLSIFGAGVGGLAFIRRKSKKAG